MFSISITVAVLKTLDTKINFFFCYLDSLKNISFYGNCECFLIITSHGGYKEKTLKPTINEITRLNRTTITIPVGFTDTCQFPKRSKSDDKNSMLLTNSERSYTLKEIAVQKKRPQTAFS